LSHTGKWRRRRFRQRLLAFLFLGALVAGAYWLGRTHSDLRLAGQALDSDHESDTLIPHLFVPELGVDFKRWSPDGPSPDRPWVAIIIDDFGQTPSLKIAPEFLKLPFPVTISVIPDNPRSADVAKLAREAGRELFIHLPMEPEKRVSMAERDMVLTGMSAADLKRILDRATADVAGAVGLNNHMGSRATSNEALMRELAAELKQRGLLFIDSRTGYASCAYRVMTGEGVPALWRDVFLDNERDTTHIARQIAALARVARTRGWAIGVGHSHPQTLAMLKRLLPQVIADGARVVTVSELVAKVGEMRREALAAGE